MEFIWLSSSAFGDVTFLFFELLRDCKKWKSIALINFRESVISVISTGVFGSSRPDYLIAVAAGINRSWPTVHTAPRCHQLQVFKCSVHVGLEH